MLCLACSLFPLVSNYNFVYNFHLPDLIPFGLTTLINCGEQYKLWNIFFSALCYQTYEHEMVKQHKHKNKCKVTLITANKQYTMKGCTDRKYHAFFTLG